MWRLRKPKQPKPERSLPRVWITADVLDRTVEVLRQSGGHNERHEGVAYWAGRRAGDECFVVTAIAPVARTTWGSFDTTSQTNAKVVMYLAAAGLELIGQVHSHPGLSVGHSEGDDERALMPYEGFLSIIVPAYARTGMRPLKTCGIHIFERSRFRRLKTAEVDEYFRIVDGLADLRT